MTEAPEDVDPGPSFFEKYRLDQLLGKGSMGTVYRATLLADGAIVAVKFLLKTNDREQQARFGRELAVLQRVRHPAVVSVLDGALHRGSAWMALEFVGGGTLSERLRREGRLDPSVAVPLFDDLLSALEACHAAGVLHRDVKPANILLTEAGGDERPRAKLGDLGIARDEHCDMNLTAAGVMLGTPLYMPPEVLIDGLPWSPPADLYSAGAVLHEMLSGAPPVVGGNVPDICAQHMLARKPVSLRAAGIPPALAALVDRAVAKEPALRPASAREFRAALAKALSASSPSPPTDNDFDESDDIEIQKKKAKAAIERLEPATEAIIRGGLPGQVIARAAGPAPAVAPAETPMTATAAVPVPVKVSAPVASRVEPQPPQLLPPVVLRESAWIAAPLVIFGPFVLALAAISGDLVVSAWCLAALALVVGAVRGPVYRAAMREPALMIDEEGFEDVRTGLGRIPWSEVRGIQLISGKTHHVVHVALGDPDRLGSMTMYGMLTCRLEKEPRKANLFLGVGALEIDARRLCRMLEERWRAAGVTPPRLPASSTPTVPPR